MKKEEKSTVANPEVLKGLNEFFMIVGENVKKIRDEHGDTQEQLGEKIGRSRVFISQIESNIDVGVSVDTLYRISRLYHIDICEFFNGTQEFFTENKKEDE